LSLDVFVARLFIFIICLSKGIKTNKTFTAFVEYDDESKLYVGIIPNVPGAHTQGETLDELQRNLQEVLELCLEENPEIDNLTMQQNTPH
jgi:predicted RNase H-like HicB family nuclease